MESFESKSSEHRRLCKHSYRAIHFSFGIEHGITLALAHIYLGIGNERHIIHIFAHLFMRYVCLFVRQFSGNFYSAIKIDTASASAAGGSGVEAAQKEPIATQFIRIKAKLKTLEH